MAIAISEPEAGSDIGAMRTFAVRDGDDYVVNGQKLWASGAGAKDTVINVYLKTDREKNYREGMSLLLIDNDAPGVELRKLDMLGRRCTGTYEVFFNDVRVPADRLVGGENNGWNCVLSGLQLERVCSAAGSCGGALAAFDLALAYAKERVQFGRPIGTNQSIAHTLADLQTEIDAARTLMWRAAWMVATARTRCARSRWRSFLPRRSTSKSPTPGCRFSEAMATAWSTICNATSATHAVRRSPPARRRCSATCWPASWASKSARRTPMETLEKTAHQWAEIPAG